MRIIAVAVVAACLSGAAWAGVERHSESRSCDAYLVGGEVDADEISRAVELALEQAFAALEHAELDEQTLAHVESEMQIALAEVETELEGMEGRFAHMNEAEEAAFEARIEAAMERVEVAMERAAERLERAAEARERDAAKRRPLY